MAANTPARQTTPTDSGTQTTCGLPCVSSGLKPTYHMSTAVPSITVAMSSHSRAHSLRLREPIGIRSSTQTVYPTPKR